MYILSASRARAVRPLRTAGDTDGNRAGGKGECVSSDVCHRPAFRAEARSFADKDDKEDTSVPLRDIDSGGVVDIYAPAGSVDSEENACNGVFRAGIGGGARVFGAARL